MTVPNMLTVGRILLTPLLVWLIAQGNLTPALVLFLIAGLSDAFDGYLARQLNQSSRFGAYVDPLADKILLVSSFVVLWYVGLIPSWLLALTAARDIMILCGVTYLHLSGARTEMRPLGISKANTFFQLVTVFVVLASNLVLLPSWAYTSLFVVTGAFCAYSGFRYVQVGKTLVDVSKLE